MVRTTDRARRRRTGAAIYARVSDKSQDGEDKTSISEQIGEMEAHCEGRGLTIVSPVPGGGQGVVEETSRVPEDALRRQRGTLRRHRVLEVRPAQPWACTPPPPSWRWSRRTRYGWKP